MKLNNSLAFNNAFSFKAQSERANYKEADYADILEDDGQNPYGIEADHDYFVRRNYNTQPFSEDDLKKIQQERQIKENELNQKEAEAEKLNIYKKIGDGIIDIIMLAVVISGVNLLFTNVNNINTKNFNKKIDEMAHKLGVKAKDINNDGKKDLILPLDNKDSIFIDFNKKELIYNQTDKNGVKYQEKQNFEDFLEEYGLNK